MPVDHRLLLNGHRIFTHRCTNRIGPTGTGAIGGWAPIGFQMMNDLENISLFCLQVTLHRRAMKRKRPNCWHHIWMAKLKFNHQVSYWPYFHSSNDPMSLLVLFEKPIKPRKARKQRIKINNVGLPRMIQDITQVYFLSSQQSMRKCKRTLWLATLFVLKQTLSDLRFIYNSIWRISK